MGCEGLRLTLRSRNLRTFRAESVKTIHLFFVMAFSMITLYLLFKWNCRNRDNALRFQGVANESVSQSA